MLSELQRDRATGLPGHVCRGSGAKHEVAYLGRCVTAAALSSFVVLAESPSLIKVAEGEGIHSFGTSLTLRQDGREELHHTHTQIHDEPTSIQEAVCEFGLSARFSPEQIGSVLFAETLRYYRSSMCCIPADPTCQRYL